ncbi:MAG TPA: c-type cytochrome [Acidobacteriaceae bacterium]|nr:c-type cytochrome [Acidobacteriaceae bacterium]
MGWTAALMAVALLASGGCSRRAPAPAQTAEHDPLEIPQTPEGAVIWRGKTIFDHTPSQVQGWRGDRLSCVDCHLKSGTQAFAAPMYGTANDYPSFSARARRTITLEERLQECFVRSENAPPPNAQGDVIQPLVAYIHWLSRDELKDRAATGRGYGDFPDLKGDAGRGRTLYAKKCAGCHGLEGAPNPATLSPLWGPESWNDGAGMNHAEVLAAFLLRNMPADKPGTLSAQEAMDIAKYVDSRTRPRFNKAYVKY